MLTPGIGFEVGEGVEASGCWTVVAVGEVAVGELCA